MQQTVRRREISFSAGQVPRSRFSGLKIIA
jgi:hypothetical protein